ncbi:Ras GTPase-activating protein, putative [Entamoeba histolytica HM-1:IMSS-B]|uniref:Ras GTPase-activating protein, putative n=4 Tax=Entamoeba histolytica TaxID=5759 RepID=C4MAK7_ENTH1|nr:Ras GTPase-activating protein, putative [Entamoeba histolytica HM-1:IMSS]EAL45844.1 Ras GTPase-activating protein, putative [Entamoeba histolytica HM-1:IMSS]EMH77143.1 Ras GTPase-activating protein, putative [Entamoeba histolytica HM-1:IMSS-B]ENY63305.1 Ras GTPase-activating protein, putative [Entamoeba histolytica HM-1:IMSS-A]GAT98849.1 Ras GTPase-activating protein putative [Entamoeba histolytica]|eukprot:XP_651230.1 Ras GTPase-activating protein, putative [Entamoeba histolytica HM-1:IMSS]
MNSAVLALQLSTPPIVISERHSPPLAVQNSLQGMSEAIESSSSLSGSATVSPALSPRIETIKKDTETDDQLYQLQSMLLTPPSFLLQAYIKALLKKETSDSSHFDILFHYFKCRKQVPRLLYQMAELEIEWTKKCNPLFRGNTAFTKAYALYLKESCEIIIENITNKFNEVTQRVQTDQSLLNEVEQEYAISTYCGLLKEALSNIPKDLFYILNGIYSLTKLKRNEEEARKAINTLLFMRFLYTPLIQSPSLFKKVQTIISSIVLNKEVKIIDKNIEGIDEIINSIIKGCYVLSTPPISSYEEELEFTGKEMMKTLQLNKKKIIKKYLGDDRDLNFIIQTSSKKQTHTENFITHFMK